MEVQSDKVMLHHVEHADNQARTLWTKYGTLVQEQGDSDERLEILRAAIKADETAVKLRRQWLQRGPYG